LKILCDKVITTKLGIFSTCERQEVEDRSPVHAYIVEHEIVPLILISMVKGVKGTICISNGCVKGMNIIVADHLLFCHHCGKACINWYKFSL